MSIKVENLYKSFGEHIVLNGISLEIEEGKTICIMGPSGYGKTTLIGILMGIIKPDSGSIIGLEDKKISAVFQEDRLLENLSIIANIHMVCQKIDVMKIQEGIKALGLNEAINQPIRELSGGMKRRVAILRALFADYDVLFLDEAFKELDMATYETTIEYVRNKTKGKTVICITHDKDEAKLLEADRVIELDKI
ncbi:MAG: ATP-binding cassette domain-containing protein [Lachnospiraceae bacterium]|jgi:NitT/TauT family transport system ATP-binding protein|nr:ATP-binding cassette domain-containing protein [Lachnospiraceae bacterium]